MKIVVVLFVLVLTLIGGAAAGKTTTKAKKVQEDCDTFCLDKKLKEPACKESCALNERFQKVYIKASKCSKKCRKQHGLDSPATKSCDEGCTKKYEDQAAEITASCNVVCSKVKDPVSIDECKETCSPALILKALEEALQRVLQ